jgi:MFS superfamily sulfate permease-like transporter
MRGTVISIFSKEMNPDEAMESKMRHYFWPAEHPAAVLALGATAILAFAWPLENVPACVLAAVMVVVAAGITLRTRFHSAGMGRQERAGAPGETIPDAPQRA